MAPSASPDVMELLLMFVGQRYLKNSGTIGHPSKISQDPRNVVHLAKFHQNSIAADLTQHLNTDVIFAVILALIRSLFTTSGP